VKTWLMKITVNTCRDFRRSAWFRHMDRSFTPDELPVPAESPSQQDKEITIAVMHLPVKLREGVLLQPFQGMSNVAIAEALGITQQAVSGRLRRARVKLRMELEEEDQNA